MPRTSERGGPQTRVRIAEAAARLFLERGFDEVTVAEVGREAGVSTVTVFNHFPRKEDLYLDRSVDAADLLRAAVQDRPSGVDVLTSLQAMTVRLAEEQHPLSGLDDRSVPFFRTVAASPALVGRARGIAAELQQTLVEELEHDPSFEGDPTLLAALVLAGYAAVLVQTARRLVAAEPSAVVVQDHRVRLDRLFDALRNGL
ncbi:TetR/AcrR family transcriptional regulator [uncultured Friedmanniella sp.]|uniref:TetR/AcrR family transcriptional regulator n=1 Tax=uncultured Friedmanniella sp. TaxID=335381 RepID=UPI0035CC1DC8